MTDVGSSALMIGAKDKRYVLYGAGVDVSDEEVNTTYKALRVFFHYIGGVL